MRSVSRDYRDERGAGARRGGFESVYAKWTEHPSPRNVESLQRVATALARVLRRIELTAEHQLHNLEMCLQ